MLCDLSSHSLQRVELIGHHDNENIFSFSPSETPMLVPNYSTCYLWGWHINQRQIKGYHCEGRGDLRVSFLHAVIPEANIQLTIAESERGLTPIQETQRNPMQTKLLCVLCVETQKMKWSHGTGRATEPGNGESGREESNVELPMGTPLRHNQYALGEKTDMWYARFWTK